MKPDHTETLVGWAFAGFLVTYVILSIWHGGAL